MSFEIVQQRNLLFQLGDSLANHGLFASRGRIRRIEVQSQARMVGAVEALHPVACQTFADSRVPNCSKRPAQRRTVDGSGDRDVSATSGRSLPIAVRLPQQLPGFLPAVEAVGPRRR
jgi:hypothetical protein